MKRWILFKFPDQSVTYVVTRGDVSQQTAEKEEKGRRRVGRYVFQGGTALERVFRRVKRKAKKWRVYSLARGSESVRASEITRQGACQVA